MLKDRKINPGAIPVRRAGAPGAGMEHVPDYRLEIERMQGEMLDYLVEGAPADTIA